MTRRWCSTGHSSLELLVSSLHSSLASSSSAVVAVTGTTLAITWLELSSLSTTQGHIVNFTAHLSVYCVTFEQKVHGMGKGWNQPKFPNTHCKNDRYYLAVICLLLCFLKDFWKFEYGAPVLKVVIYVPFLGVKGLCRTTLLVCGFITFLGMGLGRVNSRFFICNFCLKPCRYFKTAILAFSHHCKHMLA